MSNLEEYQELLEELVEEAADGEPIWRDAELLGTGLPRRKNPRKLFRGINALLLWHVQRRESLPTLPLQWVNRTYEPLASAPVIAWRPDQDPPILAVHEVLARPLRQLPHFPSPEGLASALHRLGVSGQPDGSPGALAVALDLLIVNVQRPYQAWERTKLHVWLRRSMGSVAAERLVGDLATAFLLARAHVEASPPNPHPIPEIAPRHLPKAAHLAWEFARQAWAQLSTYSNLLWPIEPELETEPETPWVSQKLARSWADHLVEELETSLSVTDLVAAGVPWQLADHFTSWLRERPRQVAAWMVKHLRESDSAPETPSERLEVVFSLLDEVAQPPQVLSSMPSELSLPALWRQSGREFCESLRDLEREPVELDGMAAHEAWERAYRTHLRATWPHQLYRISVADLLSTRLPFEVGTLMEIKSSPMNLTEVGQCLGRSPQKPVEEHQLFQALHRARPLGQLPRRENRALRESIPSLINRGSAQQSLFVAPEPDVPVDWPALVNSLELHRYERMLIPKRRGKPRPLDVPNERLASAQRQIAQVLARYFPGSSVMAGFQPHRSVAWHARMHAGARQAVVVDIRDFFGSVRPEQLRRWFYSRGFLFQERRVPVPPFAGWSKEGCEALLQILFHPGVDDRGPFLAQGAPSSPVAANLAAVRMDRKIWDDLIDQLGEHGGQVWRYSRYADDLVLSAQIEHPNFFELAESILARGVLSQGWKLNRRKTRRWRIGEHPLVICGVRVPTSYPAPLSLPRATARRVRSARHRMRAPESTHASENAADRGLLSYAYGITADPALIGWHSRSIRSLAKAVAGPLFERDFLLGWTSA
jgi:hypothetical protein